MRTLPACTCSIGAADGASSSPSLTGPASEAMYAASRTVSASLLTAASAAGAAAHDADAVVAAILHVGLLLLLRLAEELRLLEEAPGSGRPLDPEREPPLDPEREDAG